MADTSEQQTLSEPHTNGVMDGLTEEEKSKMRPADIDADMREMERRKRVEMMMNSRLFREELERIIETQMKDGAGPSGLLQQISDMMGAQGARFNGNVFKSSNCVLPINDIRGVESMGYAKGEKLLRCKLAAVFRLLDLYGWTQGVGGQITARLNQDQEHFLVNPYGLLYHEITASSLVKVDMQGTIVEQGTTNFGVHVTGFQLHSTIHAARPDIKCIVHITTPSVTAISSLKCGLLPIGQESIVIGEVSTHQYIGGSFEPEEKEKIARNLGPVNKVMLLTNRGALCCGETVEEAFFNVYNTVLACETQLKLMPAGLDNLNLITEESKKAIFEASRKPPTPQQTAPISESTALAEKLEKRWRIGGTEFEALMRMLDNAGFRTGYIYRNPLVKGEPPRPRNDVEVPPAVSSLGYLLEEEELYKQGLWKGGRKGTDRSRWLNSPNVYQKVEILETGTPDPKKITKWVSDGSPTHSSTPVKIDSALQFVPKNTNPKEFKQIQQQIKDYRRADKISAGPQSHILEGVTWEEAKKMQDATISGTGEQVVLVGAASKGIIQRGFQHNAMVYKTPYAKNPFDAVTDQELDQYKKEVERKQKGDPYDESQSESEALSSFNVSRATHESSTAKSPIQSPVSVTSETEEESRDEPRVLRIETKQVPVPSQPEVVLSDDRDSSSRCCSESENYQVIENEMRVDSQKCCHCQDCICRRHEPRLEVARSGVIAQRMTPTIISYSPKVVPRDATLDRSRYVSDVEKSSFSCFAETERREGMPKLQASSSSNACPNEKIRKGSAETGKNDLSAELTNASKRIVEIVNDIDANLRSSNTKLNALRYSDFKASTKYHLDPVDMTLLYRLTPIVDSEYPDTLDEGGLRASLLSLVERDEPNNNLYSRARSNGKKNFECKQQWWKTVERDFDGKHDHRLWFDEYTFESTNLRTCSSVSERTDDRSNEGSDTLELPDVTILRLLDTNDDAFRNDISDSANEIIAELDANDTYANIFCLVAEIFERVCTLCSNRQFIDQHVTPRISSSSFTGCSSPLSSEALASSTLLSTLKDHCELVEMDANGTSQESFFTENRKESVPLFVVHEIVHHVIDADTADIDKHKLERKFTNILTEVVKVDWSFKNAKNSANVELKEAAGSNAIDEERESAGVHRSKEEESRDVCVQVPVSWIRTNKESTESASREEAVIGTECDAIFEFRTIAKRNLTSDNDRAVELNFRVETSRGYRNIVDDEETDQRTDRRRCENPNENDAERIAYNGGTVAESPFSSFESVNCAEREASAAYSCENSDEQMESLQLSGSENLSDDETLSKSFEICDECIYCVSRISRDGKCPLSPVEEEIRDAIADKKKRKKRESRSLPMITRPIKESRSSI
nr:uncharacterized protein LOC116431534 isoform X1 [Nomia melanderi]XP_031842973.1 uncharacterized protein LOC116431534 isoform X1 [Nomia melanderi]XP_031842974.1 uncharacterized protein LOC116431534 isoform X1 [Nomia melanderi]